MDAEPEGLGAYRILRRLPASTRDVFLAKNAEGKEVVLKVYGAPQRNQGLLDPKLADEASAYARLSHPNIVKVLDMFSADGRFVIALEYVDGSSLGVIRAALARANQTVPDVVWLHVMSGVFAALAEAHAAKDLAGKSAPVLHRSVNPSNVLVGWDGSVKLGNFNVAHSVEVRRDSNPGIAWGSYGYFAPEQVKLETPSPKTDVYSATIVLWELLTGRKAIERGSRGDAELLLAMTAPNIPPLEQLRRDVEPKVRYAVRAGLDPLPDRRFVDAGRMRDVLRQAVDAKEAHAKLVELLVHARTSIPPPATHTPAPPPAPDDTAPNNEPSFISIQPDPEPSAAPVPPIPRVPPPRHVPTLLGFKPQAMPAPVPDTFPAFAPLPPTMMAATPPVTPLALEPPPKPMSLPPRSRTPSVAIALGALVVVGSIGALVAVKLHAKTNRPEDTVAVASSQPTEPASATATVSVPASATATVSATATATATVTATATAPATATETPGVAPDHGLIELPASAAGHRVYIDGHIVGEGNKPIDVTCGAHRVRVGHAGKSRTIDVPCGGTFTLD